MKSIYEDETVCLLSILHPACTVPANRPTDVARTFAEHSRADDYQQEQIETARSEEMYGNEGADYWRNQD